MFRFARWNGTSSRKRANPPRGGYPNNAKMRLRLIWLMGPRLKKPQHDSATNTRNTSLVSSNSFTGSLRRQKTYLMRRSAIVAFLFEMAHFDTCFFVTAQV